MHINLLVNKYCARYTCMHIGKYLYTWNLRVNKHRWWPQAGGRRENNGLFNGRKGRVLLGWVLLRSLWGGWPRVDSTRNCLPACVRLTWSAAAFAERGRLWLWLGVKPLLLPGCLSPLAICLSLGFGRVGCKRLFVYSRVRKLRTQSDDWDENIDKSQRVLQLSVTASPVLCCRSLALGPGFGIVGWNGCLQFKLRELPAYDWKFRSCVKVEVAVLGSPSLISLMVYVGVKKH